MTQLRLTRTFEYMESPLTGGRYEIVVGAEIDDAWSGWFEELDATSEGENTRLVGTMPDQAALHGVLARLRDLGISIMAVNRLPSPGDGV